WIIGKGLKLQSEPVLSVLKTEGIQVNDLTDFKAAVEARFNLWAKSKRVDYKGQDNLHALANSGYKTGFLGGDYLVILRVEEGELNVQVIDGQQVQSPIFDDAAHKEAEKKGNTIRNGIEKDSRGRHVAFYVRVEDKGSLFGKFERVAAYGENTGRKMAWMVYFDKHRIDHDRGIGALTSILEKIEKLDRYTEATVGSAEERAKMVLSIEHSADSTGENPLAEKMRIAMGRGTAEETKPDSYSASEQKAKDITRTTSKQVVNLPIGSKLVTPSSSGAEINFPEFWKAVFNCLAAAVDIPPEVALQMYNSNYSASRAAINGWQQLMDVSRDKFASDFYKPIFERWLELEVLKSKVNAPGYLSAIKKKNVFGLEAYAHCRFTGSNMPHIDPLKEVKAIREMLGSEMDGVSLISLEQAAEKLNSGDWLENYKKFTEEQKTIPKPNVTDKSKTGE
ncbi:MAG TPA: phage portal protein, partial [Salinimicrobium sp.]|nr:phage portal protein [Salinimicrobium sp.]